jgi:CheY-like chemotaxis protein
MPQMDGLEATEAIRALPEPQRSVPIIAMTANALQGDAELCLERGMNDYLSKPVLMDALQRVILRNRRDTEAAAKGDATDAPPPTLDPKAEIDHAALDTLSTQLGADMVDEILTIFSEDTDHRLAGIATAAQDKTSGIIAKQAHSIKGSAASLGLQRLVRAAAALETAALADEWPTIVNCCASLVAAKHGFDAWLKDRI